MLSYQPLLLTSTRTLTERSDVIPPSPLYITVHTRHTLEAAGTGTQRLTNKHSPVITVTPGKPVLLGCIELCIALHQLGDYKCKQILT